MILLKENIYNIKVEFLTIKLGKSKQTLFPPPPPKKTKTSLENFNLLPFGLAFQEVCENSKSPKGQ